MTDRRSVADIGFGLNSGLSLLEVLVAMALLAVGGTAIIGVLASVGSARSTREMRATAAHLDVPLVRELGRLRDATEAGPGPDGLNALAEMIPAGGQPPLRMVGSRDGLRVVRESDAGDSIVGVPSGERLFLLEVRQVEGPMGFAPGNGVLVVAALVRWPYREVSPSGGALTLVVAIGV